MSTSTRGGPVEPPTVGTDEETVRIERELFERRRREGRQQGRGRRHRPLWIALAVVLAGVLVWLVGWSSVLASDDVEVHGVDSLDPVTVEDAARVPMGVPMVRINTDAVRARLSAIPAIESTRVSRQWPGTVRIDVTERTPVAVVPRQGSWRALSADGVLFRRYDARPKGLPEIEDETGADQDALQEAARVVGALPADVLRRVDHVSVATVDGIELTLRDDRTVQWGSSGRSADKAKVLALFTDKRFRTLDVSVPSRPTTR
ncbi:cell division protein FtsQ [Marmoricola endophyticus]|uniref:Cell division protein FtsQ n=1 Tax=Marmoricola endophyticus TaxID=2040280 RepID=A0A917BGB2_9ACTN|nr:FtsQ-type POTRA domain-containing protein [Marmoricola endophyticus]GGF37927.1 cell division protein FtsQ [Marmoricola endophyticus]